jgi:hypothetical protein
MCSRIYTPQEDCQVSNESDEDPSEFSSSDHGGHDDRQPKRRSSAKYFGASEWTTKEWKILRASGNISDSDDASDDDSKPCFHTKPSKSKIKWSSKLGQRQVKAGIVMLQEQAQQFKSFELPDSITYLGPKLKKGRAFEDAKLQANATGTCGLAALTSRAFANKINSMCKAPLPPLLNAYQEESDKLKAWRDGIRQDVAAWNFHIKIAFDLGAKLATVIFNKETEAIHQQLAKSFELAPISNILLNSSPSETLLFLDDKKIAKAKSQIHLLLK